MSVSMNTNAYYAPRFSGNLKIDKDFYSDSPFLPNQERWVKKIINGFKKTHKKEIKNMPDLYNFNIYNSKLEGPLILTGNKSFKCYEHTLVQEKNTLGGKYSTNGSANSGDENYNPERALYFNLFRRLNKDELKVVINDTLNKALTHLKEFAEK